MPPTSPHHAFKSAPRGLAMLTLIGPSLVWCAEYIGSGEVILATRTGAVLGIGALWAIVLGIFMKYVIGLSGAIYTVGTGEGMIDMFARMPGPRNWAVWLVLVVQLGAGAIAMGSLAVAAGAFLSALTSLPASACGWLATLLAVAVVWRGEFHILKIVMSLLIAVTVFGVIYVAGHVLPDTATLLFGLIPHSLDVPTWAVNGGVSANPWREILPLLGWGAGGFASQVWYSYWVLGAGFGAASGAAYGQAADTERLRNLTAAQAHELRGWYRIIYVDATTALLIGTTVTAGFLIAGAGILGVSELVPAKDRVAETLAEVFTQRWGRTGAVLFFLGGSAAMLSTLIGQFAGWPRLLSDALRICIPGWSRMFPWKTQFRILLVFFFCTNMLVVYLLGYRPVVLVQIAAIVDGLLLTPFQAIWIAVGLFVVMPRFYNAEAARVLRPPLVLAVGLLLAAAFFGSFAVVQVPYLLE